MVEVRFGGRGTQEDAWLVMAELDNFPRAELEMLTAQEVGIVVCRDSVVDYRPDLARKTPRNWPPGVNWSAVPGCYASDEKNVIIATMPDGSDGRRIPPQGVKHGSWNLVLHEVMHADDYCAGRLRCRNPEFVAARTADFDSLGDYERREGQAGLEESYAESAARFFGNDPSMLRRAPMLHAFWKNAKVPLAPGRSGGRRRGGAEAAPIGTASLLEDGTIELDLRGESDDAVFGHALVSIDSLHPAHEAVLERMQHDGRRRRRDLTPRTVILDGFADE